MKVLTFLLLCFASVALADDFKTIDGKEYKNVTVSRIEPDGIVVMTSSGVSKIYFADLPEDVQRRFHYDAQKAAAYTAGQNEKAAAYERQQLADSQQRAQERKQYWSEHAVSSPTQNAYSPNVSADQPAELAENPKLKQGPQNCYMEVRNVLSGLEIQRNWETSWGSYDRDHFGWLILNIRLGTVGRAGGQVKIQWFFVGRKLSDMNTLIIYGKGEKMVAVPARYFAECYAAAPIVKSHTLNLAALGERYVSGVLPDSWIVCATDSRNNILAEKASSESLLNLFNDPAQFSRLQSLK